MNQDLSVVEGYMQLHEQIFNPERIPYAIAAILISMVVGVITGPLAGNANPFFWQVIDKIFGRFGDRLNKTQRPRADLLFRGFMITALTLVLTLGLGKALELAIFKYPLYTLSEALVLSLLIASGSVWFALLRLYFAIEQKTVGEGAYFAIARSARVNLSAGDDLSITRCAMGFAVRSYDKGMVGPVVWYLIGGLPFALIYSALAALGWRFGKDGFTKGFGSVALAIEKLMGFAPSLFAAFMIIATSMFSPSAKIGKGLASLTSMKNRASYEQGGLPLTVLAWALNLSLGGAFQDISGSAIKGTWVGPEGATAKNDHKHLRRALIINVVAQFLFIVVLACAYLWSSAF